MGDYEFCRLTPCYAAGNITKIGFMKKSKARQTVAQKDFLVVGMGASAGGIQALRTFFEQVAPDSEAAYVVILHLSPDRDSQLAEILQNVAAIPVAQVTEKVRVEPNRVYVVPPNRHLVMVDGHLAVTPNQTVEERRAPIDIFFRTLAESHGELGVAVVLSGTGANGSMGLKRVKERGGAVFVQNPREAEYDDMPRHALATELVDASLPVAEMPAKIVEYRRNLIVRRRFPVAPEISPDQQQQALREIFTQLRARTGHDFSNYKRPTLLRRIARRMNVRNIAALPVYAAFLRTDADETHALLKDLLISVTNFFRDHRAFAALEREVVPRILDDKPPNAPIRVWVAGCATGEEAYSVAMLLTERTLNAPHAPRIQIFATDIDETAIATAREGFYTANDAADVSPERLRRFFHADGTGYRVRRELREMILFAQHNLLKDPPFARLDLATCRNLLIYLNQTAQTRVLETLHFALNPGGFLFLGNSESIDGASDLFAPLEKEHRIFQSRASHIKKPPPLPALTPTIRFENLLPTRSEETAPVGVRHWTERLSAVGLHQQLLEAYAPPSLVVNEEYDIVHVSERARRYLEIPAGEPSFNLLKVAKEDLRLDVRTALYQAAQRRTTIKTGSLTVRHADRAEAVHIVVRPMLEGAETDAHGFFLVLFEPAAASDTGEMPAYAETSLAEPVARQLENELTRTKTQLRAAFEQHEVQTEELRASNEELQAINEELRSAAEELETSKEEAQSLNEELSTVNQELKVNIEEVTQSKNNLLNLINSTDIGTIFLDRAFRVQLFTPAAGKIFNLIPNDFGRPLSDITHRLREDDLLTLAETVLDKLQTIEREVRTLDGRDFLMRLLPYRTADDRIQGVVVTFFDITARARAEEALRINEERIRGQKEAFQTAIDGATLADSLNLLARIVKEETGGQARTAFYLADENGTNLHPVYGAGDMPEAYLHEIDGFAIGKDSRACGLAIPKGFPVVTRDVHEEPLWQPFVHLADKYEYRGCWSFPIQTRDKKGVGTLAMYFRNPREATPQDLALAAIVTQSAAVIINSHTETQERARVEEELRESEEKFRTLFETIDEGFSIIELIYDESGANAVDWRWLEANQATERHTGIENPTGKLGSEVMPQTESLWLETYDQVARTGEALRFENYHEDTGRWFHLYVSRVGGAGSRQIAFVFNDITERKRREANLALLAEITDDLTRLTTPDEIIEAVGARLGAYLHLSNCVFQDVDDERGLITSHHAWSSEGAPNVKQTFRIADYLTEEYVHAQRAGEVFIMGDTGADARANAETYAGLGVKAGLSVPFQRNGRWTACIAVTDTEPRDWQPEEIELVREIADRVFPRIERARAEEALRASEERTRAIVSQTTAGIAQTDADGTFNFVNEKYCTMLGASCDEIIGTKMQEWTHPDDVPHNLELFGRLVETGEPFEIEKRYVRRDNSIIWVHNSVSAVRGGNGEIQQLVAVSVDITTRKRAEEALCESEERFRAIVNQTTVGVARTDAYGKMTFVNRKLCTMLGYAHESQALGKTLWDFIETDMLAATQHLFAQLFETGETFEIEEQMTRSNGEKFWAIINVSAQRAADGKLYSTVAVMLDISERKQAAEALRAKETLQKLVRAQEDERRRIASDIHDHLGQQLTALRLKLEVLRGLCDAAQAQAILDETQARAAQIDADIDFISWELRPSALDDMGLAAALETYVLEWSRNFGITADFDASRFKQHQRLTSEAETNLYRIAQEILNNVAKHARARRVDIALERREGSVVLIIEDDGQGFDHSDVLQNVKSIGISGMRDRAALLGGQVEIESAPGNGTTVFVRVPLEYARG